jgi:hypothetical protein
MGAKRSIYKDNPVIILYTKEDEKYPFSFGLTKAKLILDNLEEIKKFVSENEKNINN